ncbi:PLP-dependent transferase [Aureobasidium pullulans]|nr:PLP-dependent transferase [Aureobasidium pullulans]
MDVVMAFFRNIPGSAILVGYVRSRCETEPLFFAVELMLVFIFLRYICARSYSYNLRQSNSICLTESEIDELIEAWTPEPLTTALTPLEENALKNLPIIVGPTGPRCMLQTGRTVTNLATYNFYDFAGDDRIKENAIKVLRKYGVGPCSAPGFYGTQDLHMDVEANIASFLGTESCLLYSQAFSTMSSIISAFAKRGDVIVADEACNYSICNGLRISRSKIYWYRHNDMEDLARILAKIVKDSKTISRRFIVTEGLFDIVGDMVHLPEIIKLKREYKFRLILDESNSIGVLGRTGRGVTEAYNVDISQVDILGGSLSGPFAAAGGFCASSREVVEHQRINSPAFCYSCALPGMLATTAGASIGMLQAQPELLSECRSLIAALREQIAKSDWVISTSSHLNPVQILVFKTDVINSEKLDIIEQEELLQAIINELLSRRILISRLKCVPPVLDTTLKHNEWLHRPALKVSVMTGLSKREVFKAGLAIRQVISKIMRQKQN